MSDLLRLACPADAPRLLAIYAPYITDTAITFEYDVPSAEAFAGRIANTLAAYPYLVCERDGVPVGYAYAHRLRERAAYDWAVELSVYVEQTAQGRGLGEALYRCLIDLLAQQNLRSLYGCVTLPNARSERLHRRLGFEFLGAFHQSGWKFDAWHDVGWFEKRLGGAQAPMPVVLLPQLDKTEIQAILTQYTEMLNREE